jgi:hypothetical protein
LLTLGKSLISQAILASFAKNAEDPEEWTLILGAGCQLQDLFISQTIKELPRRVTNS